MRKQTKIRILVILLLIFVIGTITLIFTNDTKDIDFGSFIITVPSDSDITVSNSSSDYFVCHDYEKGITITYMNSSELSNSNLSLNTSDYTPIYSDFTLDGAELYKVYDNTSNSNKYIAIYNTTGQYFAFSGKDIDTAVDIMNSLKIKSYSY